MIFGSELEIGQRHSNEGSDNEKNNEHNEQNAINGVDLMAPNTSKDVIQFDIYSTEWQKTSHCHLWHSSSIPRQLWNFSWILRSATRGLEFCLAIFTSNATQNKQRWGYQSPNENNNNNGAKWKSSSRLVSYSYSIEEAECQEKRSTKEAPC